MLYVVSDNILFMRPILQILFWQWTPIYFPTNPRNIVQWNYDSASSASCDDGGLETSENESDEFHQLVGEWIKEVFEPEILCAPTRRLASCTWIPWIRLKTSMLIGKQRSQVMAYKNGVLRTSVQLGPNLVRPAEQNWRLSQWSRTIDSKSITHILPSAL